MQKTEFLKLPQETRKQIFIKAATDTGLPPQSIEKDWWVTAILRSIYSLDYADGIQFKGGTSLSKCWGLINRFSEDIDLAINPELLGFGEHLSKSQVNNRLRRAGKNFILGQFTKDLTRSLRENGIPDDTLKVSNNDNGIPTQDPVKIFLDYQTLFPEDEYISPRVMLEITGRANKTAQTRKETGAIIDGTLPMLEDTRTTVTTIEPTRTFIEKVCLLHEEFNKPHGKIRHERMSRHLYDLYMMCRSGIDKLALNDEGLFTGIIRHRFIYNRIDGVDYNTETPGKFNIIPPGENLELWHQDYDKTMSGMIHGQNRPRFDEIISRIRVLNMELNQMTWKETPFFEIGDNGSGSTQNRLKGNIERYRHLKNAEQKAPGKEQTPS